MATLVTRSGKGSPLTHAEVDANFTNLNTDKLELSGGTMTGNLSFGDNDKAIFGAGSDLQIYHDGATSLIDDTGTGNLAIKTNGGGILLLSNDENLANFVSDGAVNLYYDNSKKLATTSTGIDVTGTVNSDAFSLNAGSQVSSVGTFYLDIDSDNNSTGAALNITSDNKAKFLARFQEGGDISFYEDTGTTAKFFWDASAESLGIGTSSPSQALSVESSSVGVTRINVTNTGNAAAGSGVQFITKNGATQVSNATLRTDNAGNFSIFTGTTGEAERMRIDSSGYVGIGTSSPTAPLHVDSKNENAAIQISANTGFNTSINFYNGGAAKHTIQSLGDGSGAFRLYDFTANAERMRIDSSGNLLVGKTTIATGTAGIALRSNGEVRGTANGDYAARFSRLSSDGAIVGFEKDGTTVGSIGTSSSVEFGISSANDLVLTQNTTTQRNLLFRDSFFGPFGADNNAIDLGRSVGRFKDLYLSGGVYLGGTGAANKLDDYEEGTWTAVDASGAALTFSSVSGYYVKIGRMVYVSGAFTYPSTASGLSASVGGLPFTTGRLGGAFTMFVIGSTHGSYVFRNTPNSTQWLVTQGADNDATATNANLSSASLQLTGFYQVGT